ncbi:hypothetical protein [Aquirufa aurantiipilula]|jgi:hypothetical protein|uniref:Uncharacterized protein n=1 Tax=Aquirufa aurantiipilula TaxID=2696561 RepID=A0ABT6BIU1_9BACT|nr:hypothetical protein [Aquirufa aurantiipilula]MDF5690297.1 hypothetical protein [Aquirufa aurantiipilula]
MLFIQEALTYGNGILQHALDVMNGCSVEVKEALILLLLSNDEVNKGMTKQFFEENPKLKGIPPIQTVVEFICEDNFKEKVPCDDTNLHIWTKLRELKQEMIDYYTHNVCESNEGGKFYEFHTKFLQMSLKLKRLRMVIQPEFHVIKNVHPVSKIPYLSVRGFWLDDNDKKVKVFTKSMGREDSFVDGKNDSELLREAAKQIQQLSFAKYQECYS